MFDCLKWGISRQHFWKVVPELKWVTTFCEGNSSCAWIPQAMCLCENVSSIVWQHWIASSLKLLLFVQCNRTAIFTGTRCNICHGDIFMYENRSIAVRRHFVPFWSFYYEDYFAAHEQLFPDCFSRLNVMIKISRSHSQGELKWVPVFDSQQHLCTVG